MDDFAEANLMLNSALEQLDDIIRSDVRQQKRTPNSRRYSPLLNGNTIRMMKEVDEGLDMDNGNGDDERPKTSKWASEWRQRRESEGSSGVESPPSDIPTSTSSLSNPPKLFQDFVRAIDDHTLNERPDLETRLKIMRWLAGRTGSVAAQHVFCLSVMYSDQDLRRQSTLTVSSHSSQDPFLEPPHALHSSDSGNVFRESTKTFRSSRPVVPYTTHYSDSGFGSALSAGSSCSYLPPPPPYRFRPRQRKIHRSLSDSRYSPADAAIVAMCLQDSRKNRGNSWTSRISLSPSPSMSTVSCPEYPELQEKLHRLAMARDSLSLQVSVLTEQVGAQKEKIKDLESLLVQKHSTLNSTEELLQDKYRRGDPSELESKKIDLLAEVSSLKLKFANLEREKIETEKKLMLSQSEMEHVNQSMHGVMQQQLHNQINGHYMPPLREKDDKHDEEMDHLRTAVHRLMMDNEQKNMQINSLRTALDEQLRRRQSSHSQDDYYQSPQWAQPEQPYDLNTQIRRLLMEEPNESMSHSTSFPVSLCSSSVHPTPRSTVQSSSSYTSSLSAASPQHSWSVGGTPRHLQPSNSNLEPINYRSPSSPAARQLAAELDELRRLGDHSRKNYSTASLPRGMGVKAASTLTLPPKKMSMTSGASASELRSLTSNSGRKGYRAQMNRWISEKLKRSKRSTSAPNLVESDDEITRGKGSTTGSMASTQNLQPLRRDRTRNSLRNLFSKLKRSTSQDHHTFRRGSAARSTSSARLGSNGFIPGAVAVKPPLSQFVDWRSEQLAEWMGEVGFAQYMSEVSRNVRTGRHLLNMNTSELENIVGMKNALHRKRLLLLLKRIEDDTPEPAARWDVNQTMRWLEEIGIPQYKEAFEEHLIDGPMLLALTAGDAAEMRIINAHHYLTLSRSIQYLKSINFKFNALDRRYESTSASRAPCPEVVVRWTHAATCEWLRSIDLSEFTPNLLCAGVPGALMIFEPTFTAESMAEILQIPAHKTLLRRHLTSHFNQLLGQKLIAEKRDFLATGTYPQLSPHIRIKVVKKGFSLTRKKTKHEIIIEPEEPLCPLNVPTLIQNGEDSSLESSNV